MVNDIGLSIVATLIVALFAWIGGLLIQLTKGLNPPEIFPNWRTRPLVSMIILPSLFGQLIFGCVARNALYVFMDKHYSEEIGTWIQMIGNLVIFVRSGLELEFRSQGLMILLLSVGPLVVEGIVVALATRFLFSEIPWSLAFGLGFIVSDNTASIMVPLLIKLHEAGYGGAKNIPITLLTAQSFDNIIALPLFGVCQAITINSALGQKFDIVSELLDTFYKIIVGFASAFVFGTLLWFIRDKGMNTKFFAIVTLGIGQLVFYTLIDFNDSKYIAVIFLGYFALRVWGDNKPDEELNVFWNISKPFLFGAVGAQILIREMEYQLIGYCLVIVLLGMLFRFLTTYFAFYESKYNKYERIFTAVAWLPKATVQAAFGGIILSEAKSKNIPELVRPGIIFLTICILSIIVSVPPGAILTVTFGQRFLERAEKHLSSRLSKFNSRGSQNKSPYGSAKASRIQSRTISKLHTLKEEAEENEIDSEYYNTCVIKKNSDVVPNAAYSKSRTMSSEGSYFDNMSIFTEENLIRNIVYDIFDLKKCQQEDEKNSIETQPDLENATTYNDEIRAKTKHPYINDD